MAIGGDKSHKTLHERCNDNRSHELAAQKAYLAIYRPWMTRFESKMALLARTRLAMSMPSTPQLFKMGWMSK